jgi:hypothetical protein
LRNWVIDNHVESLPLPKAISSAKFVIVTAASKQAADFRTLLLFFGFSITQLPKYAITQCLGSGKYVFHLVRQKT